MYPKNYYCYLPQFYSFPSYESYGQNCPRIKKWPHSQQMRKIEMMKRILTRSLEYFSFKYSHFHAKKVFSNRMFESVVKSLEKCPEICSNCSGFNYFGHCLWYLGSKRAFYAPRWISTRDNWMVDRDAHRYSDRFNERIFHSLSLLLQVIFQILIFLTLDSFVLNESDPKWTVQTNRPTSIRHERVQFIRGHN